MFRRSPLPPLRGVGAFPILSICVLAAGCMVPASNLTALQEQYQQVCEQNKAMSTQLASLDAHSRKVEQELNQTEEDLTALEKRSGLDRRRLSNYENERDRLYSQYTDQRGSVPTIISDQLAALAQRYPSLYYDTRTGVAKLDTDVLFATGEAELQPQARDLLSEFAAILRSQAGSNLRMMVVGHTDDQRIKGEEARQLYPNNWHLGAARALAVTDFLRVRGVREQRMGIASYGRFQPVAANSSDGNRQRNRRVELFLIAPEVPVVGWTETIPSVYR